MVFFADLLQLPPVEGNQPFMNVTALEGKQRVGSTGHVNLWEHFQYDELAINMRHSGDRKYADLLSAVRINQVSDDQVSLLKQQLIAKSRRATLPEITDKYQELADSDCNAEFHYVKKSTRQRLTDLITKFMHY